MSHHQDKYASLADAARRRRDAEDRLREAEVIAARYADEEPEVGSLVEECR